MRVLPSPVFSSAILPLGEHNAADELYIAVAQAQGALAGFAHGGKGFRQKAFQSLSALCPLQKLVCPGL